MNKKRIAACGLLLVILLTFTQERAVYANDMRIGTCRRVERICMDLKHDYTEEQMGIRRCLTFHVDGYIDVEWYETYNGWVNALILDISDAQIDGVPYSCGLGSSPSQRNICNFTINHQTDIVTVESFCDEWGDYNLCVVLNR